jgi:uncharacterized protein
MTEMQPPPTTPPPGWYHDGTTMRWWDGTAWGPVAPPVGFGAPPADPVSDGTTLAVLCHVGQIFAGVVLALVIRLTEGTKNEYVRHHSTEALNFQLTFLIVWLGGMLTTFGTIAVGIGFGGDEGDGSAWFLLPFALMFAALGVGIVFAVVDAIRASQGRWWRYPISIRFVRGARPKGETGPS